MKHLLLSVYYEEEWEKARKMAKKNSQNVINQFGKARVIKAALVDFLKIELGVYVYLVYNPYQVSFKLDFYRY